jgi:hypothetical protein
MAQTVENIIQGAAEVYLGDKGGDFPATPTATTSVTATGNITTSTVGGTGNANYASVGYTSEGLDVSFEPDYLDVEVDQLLDSAALFKTSQRVTISTSFTEATLGNLAFTLGQAATTITGTYASAGDSSILKIEGGSLGAAPLERSFVAVGPAPRQASGNLKSERIYYHPRVISVEAVATGVKRNEATMFPVTFRCLPDSADTDMEYGRVVDRLYGTA